MPRPTPASPFLVAATALPAAAMTPEDVTGAARDGDALPDGQSGLTFAVQVLLDRAGISPCVVDGDEGGMSRSAIRAIEAREGPAVDGVLDRAVCGALGWPGRAPVLRGYRITADDASGLVDAIPDDVRARSKKAQPGAARVSEKLSKRFHLDEDVPIWPSEGAGFATGEAIRVAAPGDPLLAGAARIEVRKEGRRLVAFDTGGMMVASNPVASRSESTPSHLGRTEVVAIAFDPTCPCDPDVNFQVDGVEAALTLPSGPNGPIGPVRIDLSKPTFGLHGTDRPAMPFETDSHGCVRFTNWDIEQLAGMVSPGTTVALT
jgi:peptidoglycan hydrolase-like protein with peptidoglycan-binding domain